MPSVNTQLSDLFFNYGRGEDFPQEGSGVTMDDYKQSVLADAIDFLNSYKEILRCEIPTAEELAEDFMQRL